MTEHQSLEAEIVERLVADLRDRRALKWVFREPAEPLSEKLCCAPLDDDVQADIFEDWRQVIRNVLQGCVVTDEALGHPHSNTEQHLDDWQREARRGENPSLSPRQFSDLILAYRVAVGSCKDRLAHNRYLQRHLDMLQGPEGGAVNLYLVRAGESDLYVLAKSVRHALQLWEDCPQRSASHSVSSPTSVEFIAPADAIVAELGGPIE